MNSGGVLHTSLYLSTMTSRFLSLQTKIDKRERCTQNTRHRVYKEHTSSCVHRTRHQIKPATHSTTNYAAKSSPLVSFSCRSFSPKHVATTHHCRPPLQMPIWDNLIMLVRISYRAISSCHCVPKTWHSSQLYSLKKTFFLSCDFKKLSVCLFSQSR